MVARKRKSQLLGEFLREMAVLISVLYPLEAYMVGKFHWYYFVSAEILAAVLLYFGIKLEGEDE